MPSVDKKHTIPLPHTHTAQCVNYVPCLPAAVLFLQVKAN